MADASWDNSGLPPQKQGMPTWVKFLLGCGIVFLMLAGGCVALGAYGLHKISTLGQARWPAYVQTVKELQDPVSTRALYEANPKLKDRYATEEAFEQEVASWRPDIQTPPAQMPPITSGRAIAFEGSNHTYNSRNRGMEHGKGSVAGYKMANGYMLVVAWQNDQIAEIQFGKNDR